MVNSTPTGHLELETFAIVSRGSNGDSERRKKPWCGHWKKPWHTHETCWKIHGKPAHLKKKPDGRAFQSQSDDSQEQTFNLEATLFTKEQLEHRYKLFKSPQFSVTPCSLAH